MTNKLKKGRTPGVAGANRDKNGGVAGENRDKNGNVAGENRGQEGTNAGVRTGDETPVLPMVLTMITAGIAAIYLALRRRRRS